MSIFSKLFSKNKKNENEEATKTEQSAPVEKKQAKPSANENSVKAPKTVKNEKPVKEEKSKTETPSQDEAPKSEPVKVRTQNGFFEIKKSKDDRYVFNLYAANRVIIATSQIYSSSQAAQNGINSVIANAEKAPIEDNTLKTPTPQPFPKWEIYKDKAEQFRFRLYASNGSCICHSQGYTSKANCKNGIESIIKTAKTATVDKSYLIKK